MSRATEFQAYADDLERYLSRPIPSPPTVPTYTRCVYNWAGGHWFDAPQVDPGVCCYCRLTRAEVADREAAAIAKAQRAAA